MLGRLIDLGNPVAHDHPLNQGLVAWWLPLPNNQGGGTLFDIEGRFNGTLTNGPTWVPGPSGFAAVHLARASNHHVTTPDDSGLDFGTGSFAVAALFRKASNGIFGGLVSKVDSADVAGWTLVVNSDNTVTFYCVQTSSNVATSSTTITDTLWHVAHGYRNGTHVKLFVDGVEVGSASDTARNVNNAQALTSGPYRSGATTTNMFDGDIGGVWVWDRAPAADAPALLDDQIRRGHPDTLRRWTPRAWVFGGTAAGGGTTTQNLAGESTPTGSLVRVVSKALAGSTTPAGSLAKLAAKPLAGSTTAAGALARLTAKPLAGTATAAGSVARATAKALAGSSTPTGDLTTIRAVLQSVGGSCEAGGTVTRAASKAVAGSVMPAGAAANAVAKPLAGSITPTGAVSKQTSLSLAGSTTPAGTLSLARSILLAVGGAVTAVGSLVRAAAKAMVGFVTGTGALTRVGGSEPISVVTPGGTVRRRGNLARVIRRLPANVLRLVRRPTLGVPASRVIRGARPMPTAGEFPTESRVKGAAETVEYLFDFTPFPEIVAGETISSVSVPAVSGLTIGSPTVTAALTDGVASGKGVEVAISGGTAGTTYAVSVRATMSGGAVREIRLNLTVR